jgi:mono/diheme cytochrome c family protein
MALQLSSIIVSRALLRRLWETGAKLLPGRSDMSLEAMRGYEFMEWMNGADPQGNRRRSRSIVAALAACLALISLLGCEVERRRSDAELGLNPQQAAGRKIYDNYCDRCHRPYSTKGKKGPGMKGIFQHQYLSLSGLPANDDRVGDIIRNGRPDMPGFGQVLNAEDLQNLLAYLHTL